jgi:hypothetical protein
VRCLCLGLFSHSCCWKGEIVKSKLILLVALAFCAVQARGPSVTGYPVKCRAAKPLVAPSLVAALPNDSLNCRIVGGWDITTGISDISVVGNYAYIAGFDSGLYVLDVSNPASPQQVGRWPTPSDVFQVSGVVSDGHYAYLGNGPDVRVIDVSDPVHPTEVGVCTDPGYAMELSKVGNHLYVSDWFSRMWVIDVSDPAVPTAVGSCTATDNLGNVAADSGHAYLACQFSGMDVVDVSNPTDPYRVGRYESSSALCCERCIVSGHYVYLTEESGLCIIDVSNPASPVKVGYYDVPGYATAVSKVGQYVYVSSNSGLRVVDVSDPANPLEVGHYWMPHNATPVTAVGNYAYTGFEETGLRIIEFYAVGVKEGTQPPARSLQQTASIAHGVLFVPEDRSPGVGDQAALLDALGRRVMQLQPGPNDVRRLSPGVYFVSRPKSVEKVLLTR